jgi:hypothetical protein
MTRLAMRSVIKIEHFTHDTGEAPGSGSEVDTEERLGQACWWRGADQYSAELAPQTVAG